MNKLLRHCTLGVALMGLVLYGVSIAHAELMFGEPVKLPAPINLPNSWDGKPALSPVDELELYFTSNRNVWGTYVSQRESISAPFSTPTLVIFDGNHPSLSNDGLELYVNGSEPEYGGFGSEDLLVMTRPSLGGEWSTPTNLGPNVNTSQLERFAVMSPDGLELYFSRIEQNPNHENIWVARRSSPSAAFDLAERVPPSVNSDGWLNGPGGLSPDGLTLFIASNRPGGYGGLDIWYSTRQDKGSPWSTAVNLGPDINTTDSEGPLMMSSNGRTVLFSRSSDPNSFNDIWQAAVIPEPSSLLLALIAMGVVGGWRKWKHTA
jgi:hypothetical protein